MLLSGILSGNLQHITLQHLIYFGQHEFTKICTRAVVRERPSTDSAAVLGAGSWRICISTAPDSFIPARLVHQGFLVGGSV